MTRAQRAMRDDQSTIDVRVVHSKKGVIVRRGASTDTAEVARLEWGAAVRVARVEGARALLAQPTAGWRWRDAARARAPPRARARARALVSLEQRRPHSQFEHYGALAAEAARWCGEGCWLLFHDDDDLSHPLRARAYAEAVASAPAAARTVCAMWRCVPSKDCAEERCRARTPGAVDALLAEGLAERCGRPVRDRTGAVVGGDGIEYYHCAVRPAEVAAFCAGATRELLGSRYADVCFCRWLRVAHAAPGAFAIFEPEMSFDACWLYYYQRSPGDNLSQTVRPDLAFADAHLEDARRSCPGLPRESLAHFGSQWLQQLDLFCMIHAHGAGDRVPAGKFVFGALQVLNQLASIGYGRPSGGAVLLWLGARTLPTLLRRADALGVRSDPPAATLLRAADAAAAPPLEVQLAALKARRGDDRAEDGSWDAKLARFQVTILAHCIQAIQKPPKSLGQR
ncbi:hypothetical protein SO694_00006356 [Aureococcus anophagefferens]|uniref:Glycosyltransferase 2-like domain-containing protein n=2 Tax=Aureococcus anophagefferens TaxID=44056 RepID=A0ABR1GAW3_AURAN